MDISELEEEYEHVQKCIRKQFDEIEALSDYPGENSQGAIIERLVNQNQYVYELYSGLMRKCIQMEYIPKPINESAATEVEEFRQFAEDQMREEYEQKRQLQLQVDLLMEENNSLKENRLQEEYLAHEERSTFKTLLEDVIDTYSSLRPLHLPHLPQREITPINFKLVLIEDLESTAKYQLNLINKSSTQQKDIKQLYDIQSPSQMNEKKGSGIQAMLREQRYEVENELRVHLAHLAESGNRGKDHREEKEEKEKQMISENDREMNVLRIIVKNSIERIEAIADEISESNKNNINLSLASALRAETIGLRARIYRAKLESADQEEEYRQEQSRWKAILQEIKIGLEDKTIAWEKEAVDRTNEASRLRGFLEEYEIQLENIQSFMRDLESELNVKEQLICELNSKLQSTQLKLEDEQKFAQNHLDQKNQRVIALTAQVTQLTHSNQDYLVQHEIIKQEMANIEQKLHAVIHSKQEYEHIIETERNQIDLQCQRLKQDLEERISEFKQQQRGYDEKIDYLNKQINTKDIEIDEIQQTFNELESFSQRQLQVIQLQQAQIAKVESSIEEKDKAQKHDIRERREEVEGLKCNLEKVIQSLNISERELAMRREESEMVKADIDSLKLEYEEKINGMQRQNNELQNRSLSVGDKRRFLELEEGTSILLQENSVLTQKLSILVSNLDILEMDNAQIMHENKQLKIQRDLLQEKLFKLTDLATLQKDKLSQQEMEMNKYQQLFGALKSHIPSDLNENSQQSLVYSPQQLEKVPLRADGTENQIQQDDFMPNFGERDREQDILQSSLLSYAQNNKISQENVKNNDFHKKLTEYQISYRQNEQKHNENENQFYKNDTFSQSNEDTCLLKRATVHEQLYPNNQQELSYQQNMFKHSSLEDTNYNTVETQDTAKFKYLKQITDNPSILEKTDQIQRTQKYNTYLQNNNYFSVQSSGIKPSQSTKESQTFKCKSEQNTVSKPAQSNQDQIIKTSTTSNQYNHSLQNASPHINQGVQKPYLSPKDTFMANKTIESVIETTIQSEQVQTQIHNTSDDQGQRQTNSKPKQSFEDDWKKLTSLASEMQANQVILKS